MGRAEYEVDLNVEHLKKLIIEKGWSEHSFASVLGRGKQWFSQLEDRKSTTLATLNRIAMLLQVPVSELLISRGSEAQRG